MTRTFNWRLVFKTMGVLTTLEALFMLVPTLTAWWYHEADLGAWIVSSAITWFNSWWLFNFIAWIWIFDDDMSTMIILNV